MQSLVNFTTGKLDSNAAVPGGKHPFFTCSRENFEIDTFAFDCEALLLAGNNASADYSVKYYKGKFNAYQRTYVITMARDNLSIRYMQYALEMKLKDMKRLSKGTNTKYLTLGILNELKFQVPDEGTQAKFEEVKGSLECNKARHDNALLLAEDNFNSLVQRAFRGEL
ncbi:MAG: restriction endonuclease subunit S [Geopsychrobacter sp.]|nr:restriction endonuclease subunit S [Geopsychrobacter sp.]